MSRSKDPNNDLGLETAVKGRADVIATFNVGEISWQIQGISWQIQAAAGRGWRAQHGLDEYLKVV